MLVAAFYSFSSVIATRKIEVHQYCRRYFTATQWEFEVKRVGIYPQGLFASFHIDASYYRFEIREAPLRISA